MPGLATASPAFPLGAIVPAQPSDGRPKEPRGHACLNPVVAGCGPWPEAMSDVYQRSGRGGAGNFYSKKDIKEVEARSNASVRPL